MNGDITQKVRHAAYARGGASLWTEQHKESSRCLGERVCGWHYRHLQRSPDVSGVFGLFVEHVKPFAARTSTPTKNAFGRPTSACDTAKIWIPCVHENVGPSGRRIPLPIGHHRTAVH